MSMSTHSRPFCLIVLLVTGCASAGRPAHESAPLQVPDKFSVRVREMPGHQTVLDEPIDRVWQVVPGVYKHMGLPAAPASNTRHLVYMTPHMTIRGLLYAPERNSAYIDCGEGVGGTRADIYEVSFVLVTTVRAGPSNNTIVETMIDGNARDRSRGDSGVPCHGTGKLEREIGELIRIRVQAQSGS